MISLNQYKDFFGILFPVLRSNSNNPYRFLNALIADRLSTNDQTKYPKQLDPIFLTFKALCKCPFRKSIR